MTLVLSAVTSAEQLNVMKSAELSVGTFSPDCSTKLEPEQSILPSERPKLHITVLLDTKPCRISRVIGKASQTLDPQMLVVSASPSIWYHLTVNRAFIWLLLE